MKKDVFAIFVIMAIILLSGSIYHHESFTLPENSHSLESVETSLKISQDGSVDFYQNQTISFTGNFSEFSFEINLQDEQIPSFDNSLVSVFDDGKKVDAAVSNEFYGKNITFKINASNEKKFFSIYYKIKNRVTVYKNGADLYMPIYEVAKGNNEIKIEFPKTNENIRQLYSSLRDLWDLKAEEIDNKTLKFKFYYNDTTQFSKLIWTRVFFPTEILDSISGAKDSRSISLDPKKDDEFYMKQGKKKTQEEAVQEMYNTLIFFIAVVPASFGILFLYLYQKYGREPKLPKPNFIYFRDIPYDYGPAVAEAVLDWGVRQNDITATFLDLVRRKFFKIEESEDKSDYIISILKGSGNEIKPYEKKIYNLFAENLNKGKISLREFRQKVSLNYKYLTFLSDWQKEVEKETENLGLVDYTGWKKFSLWSSIILVFVWLGINPIFETLRSLYPSTSLPIIYISSIIPFVVIWFLIGHYAKGALAKRTLKGAEHYQKWKALKKYLQDFGSMKEKTPKEIYLWDKYLVYAVAFGIAKDVSKIMDLTFPSKDRRTSALYTGGSFSGYSDWTLRR